MTMKAKTKKPTKRQIRRAEVQPRREFPTHLNSTPEEWRALKRTQWLAVRQALDRYNHGCAYTPAYSALYDLKRFMDQVTEAIEQPDWIAW